MLSIANDLGLPELLGSLWLLVAFIFSFRILLMMKLDVPQTEQNNTEK
jgi:hypothetical protein